ncbi:helix-turn-helix domain-containing protein [Streptomyces sp. NPDC096046]|uniref:helix-turn-helix domain-containing protein n=1 Tax=Streptomyces sp. NPDC096046 TaxID=3155542 RepID=UPI0033322109
MQLRYAFRLYPDPGQRTALAKAFGCARVVFVRREVAPSKWDCPTEMNIEAAL